MTGIYEGKICSWFPVNNLHPTRATRRRDDATTIFLSPRPPFRAPTITLYGFLCPFPPFRRVYCKYWLFELIFRMSRNVSAWRRVCNPSDSPSRVRVSLPTDYRRRRDAPSDPFFVKNKNQSSPRELFKELDGLLAAVRETEYVENSRRGIWFLSLGLWIIVWWIMKVQCRGSNPNAIKSHE